MDEFEAIYEKMTDTNIEFYKAEPEAGDIDIR